MSGGEEGVLDGRRDRLDDPVGIAVQAAELPFLLRAADTDGIAAADDLRLGTFAPLRLEVTALGLDAGEGVEGGDEGHAEAMLQTVPGDTTQPVVAMDHVGPTGGLEVLGDAVGKHVDLFGERFLGEVERTGWDVNHGVPGLDEQLDWQTGTIGARVGRAVDAGLGERRRDLAHVHVHPPAVAGTWLDEWGRVEREQGDPRHKE